MARFNVEMLGDAKIAKRLQELPEKMERKVVSKALRNAAQQFARTTKPGIPRAQERKYGTGKHMADTVKVRAMKRKKHRIGFRVITGTRQELGIPEGKVYYPAVIEYGSRTLAPRAFMRGPFQAQESALRQRIVNELQDGIAQIQAEG